VRTLAHGLARGAAVAALFFVYQDARIEVVEELYFYRVQ
jgi:hypothetical protein